MSHFPWSPSIFPWRCRMCWHLVTQNRPTGRIAQYSGRVRRTPIRCYIAVSVYSLSGRNQSGPLSSSATFSSWTALLTVHSLCPSNDFWPFWNRHFCSVYIEMRFRRQMFTVPYNRSIYKYMSNRQIECKTVLVFLRSALQAEFLVQATRIIEALV